MIFYSKLLIIILKLNALSLNKCELYMNMSYLISVILYFYFLLMVMVSVNIYNFIEKINRP